jgi:hypothetical protein
MSSSGSIDVNIKKRPRNQNNGPDNSNNNNDNINDRASYNVNSGLAVKPCEKPFVGTSVELNFNFWMKNKVLNDSFICRSILTLLEQQTPSYMRKHSGSVNSVVLVCVHGLDPRELGDKLNSLPFLSDCSSMPLHHVAHLDEHNSTDLPDKKWQYMEAENMTSILLWPERSALKHDVMNGMTSHDLFSTCSLSFQVLCSHFILCQQHNNITLLS